MTDAEARRDFAEEVVRRLRRAGYQSLWAGGCVRDLILGQTPADYDVATDARPEQVRAALPFKTIPVGISFGVVRVNSPRRRGIEVEIATFRNDGAYIDGRRPESVAFSTAEEDAARRDFTINGMFLDPISGELLDYVGGRADLDRRILRAIGEPAERFREDKLRLLRAIRFAARFGLEIEPKTLAAIRAMAAEVVSVSPERIAQELKRMLVHPSRVSAVMLALETGLVAAVLPELVTPDDDWDQTTRVLGALPDDPAFTLAFAALLIGLGRAEGEFGERGASAPCPPEMSDKSAGTAMSNKSAGTAMSDKSVGTAMSDKSAGTAMSDKSVETAMSDKSVGTAMSDKSVGPTGREDRGLTPPARPEKIADGIARRLRLSNAERERIAWLVGSKDALVEARTLPKARLKRLLAHPDIGELLALHRAIALATAGDASHVDFCRDYLENEPAGLINPPPLVTGDDLMRHGLAPGPHFAKILHQIRDAQLEGLFETKEEALAWLDARG